MVTQEQLKNLSERVSKLKGYLEIDKKLIEISNEEEKTADPSFWNNPKEAEVLMKSLRFKKRWVDDYNKAVSLDEDLQVLFDFYKEGEVEAEEMEQQYEKTASIIEDIEFKNMLSEEGDSFSAVIQITAGAGGTESCDWAEMLFRMYSMWSEKQGFTLKTLNYQSGDSAGIKTVTVEVDGEYAFEIYNMDLCGSHSYDVINHKLWHKVLDFIEEKENTDQSIKILDKIINNELGLV